MSRYAKDSVGQILTIARKKKRLRYKRLSNELKIRESYLLALEQDRFKEIPGGEVFIKGFLRSYSKKLDLNPDFIIKLYEDSIISENTDQDKKNDISYFEHFANYFNLYRDLIVGILVLLSLVSLILYLDLV